MNQILKDIKKLQVTLMKLTEKFGDYGLDENDGEEAVEALNESLNINRALYSELSRKMEETE